MIQSALFFFWGSPHLPVSADLPVTMVFRNFKFMVSNHTISAKTRHPPLRSSERYTRVFQNDPFWGVLSKTSALRYVWRKTALQMQCNPPQPRAKHTTPPQVKIVMCHHAHNDFFFPHDATFDTQTTMRFCICVLEHLKANCNWFISVNYLLPPATVPIACSGS